VRPHDDLAMGELRSSCSSASRITLFTEAGLRIQIARPGQLNQIADDRLHLANVVNHRVQRS
jgi:hypothetical protein